MTEPNIEYFVETPETGAEDIDERAKFLANVHQAVSDEARQLRHRALEMAINTHGPTGQRDAILRAAKSYADYLENGTIPPEPPKPTAAT